MNSIFELINYNIGALYVIHRVQQIQTGFHWHREIEIVYVKKGKINAQFSERSIEISENQCLVINSNQVHSINSKPDTKCDVVILQINEEVFHNIGQSSSNLYFTSVIDPEGGDEDPSHIKSMFDTLDNIVETSESQKVNYKQINMYCMVLVTLLVQSFTLSESSSNIWLSDKHQYQIKQILEYIEAIYSDPSIDQLSVAKNLGFNSSYLSKLFSSYTNTTFIKYLNNLRISHVCEELEKTEDSITDIFLRNGFSNNKTFNRVFKSILGVSPSEYRSKSSAVSEEDFSDSDMSVTTSVGSYISFQDNAAQLNEIKNKDFITTTVKEKRSDFSQSVNRITVEADINGHGQIFNKPFLNLLCTGRACDIMSAPWREHFEKCINEIPFKYLRFHGIFNDEMGILHKKGSYTDYNFFYIDTVFKYLLSQNVRPYVELSFMPSALASSADTVFVYGANISKPRSMNEWCNLIEAFITHLISHFGADEVRCWYFEIWNEPDISEFWANEYKDYLELYKATYRTIKKIDKELRVGGPAGSSVAFQEKNKIISFLDFCSLHSVIPDFFSLHPYPAQFFNISGSFEELQKVCTPDYTVANMEWARSIIHDHAMDSVPVHMNEWNSSPRYDDYVHDTAYMATYVIDTVMKCSDLCDVLGWWTVSDLFDEGGTVYKEFGGGFGLINRSGLKKPAYFGMWALSRLGDTIIEKGPDYIVTVDEDHRTYVLVWNYVFFKQDFAEGDRKELSYYDRYSVFNSGTVKNIKFKISGYQNKTVMIQKYKFTRRHGSIYDFWLSNGAVEYLSEEQLKVMHGNNHLKSLCSFETISKSLIIEEDLKPFEFGLFEIAEV